MGRFGAGALLLLALLAGCGEKMVIVPQDSLAARVTELAKHRSPSVAVATAWRDRPGLCIAVGERTIEPPRAALPSTPYLWFSVSKLYTATAIMQLVEQGRIELDAPAHKYLPEFAPAGGNGRSPTVREVMSHLGGLPNPSPIRWIHLADEPGPGSMALMMKLLQEYPNLTAEPGQRHRYSNLGYLVLGVMIERVTGEPFPQYIREHVLAPLGDTHSGYTLPPDAALGHQRANSFMGMAATLLFDSRFFGPSNDTFLELEPFLVDGPSYAGLVGSACDIVRLGKAMLREGMGDSGRVLSADSVREMVKAVRTNDGDEVEQALGWQIAEHGGEPYYFHDGNGGGYHSELRVYPRLGYAVAVVANESAFETHTIADWVIWPALPNEP